MTPRGDIASETRRLILTLRAPSAPAEIAWPIYREDSLVKHYIKHTIIAKPDFAAESSGIVIHNYLFIWRRRCKPHRYLPDFIPGVKYRCFAANRIARYYFIMRRRAIKEQYITLIIQHAPYLSPRLNMISFHDTISRLLLMLLLSCAPFH